MSEQSIENIESETSRTEAIKSILSQCDQNLALVSEKAKSETQTAGSERETDLYRQWKEASDKQVLMKQALDDIKSIIG